MENLIFIFIPIVITGLLVTVAKGKVVDFLSRSTTIYSGLIVWTLIGFVFLLDNSATSGCVIRQEGIFSMRNIAYSGLSVLLLTIGLFSRGKDGLQVLFGELIYWTIKLMTIKGGYATGLGGTPDETIVMFDSVALTLRLFLIQSRMEFKAARKVYVLIVPFLVMTLKILFMR